MADRVRVIGPDGRTGSIPAEQEARAVADGFKIVTPKAKPDDGNGALAGVMGGVRGFGEMLGVPTDAILTKGSRLLGGDVAGAARGLAEQGGHFLEGTGVVPQGVTDGLSGMLPAATPDAAGDREEAKTRGLLNSLKTEHSDASTAGEVGGALASMFLGGEKGLVAKAEGLASEGAARLVGKGATSRAGRLAQWAAPKAAAGEVGLGIIQAVDSINDQALADGDISMDKTLSAVGGGLGYGAIGGVTLGAVGHGAGSLVESLLGAKGWAAEAVAKQAGKASTRALERETKLVGTPSTILNEHMTAAGVRSVEDELTAAQHADVTKSLHTQRAATLDERLGSMASDAEGLGISPSASDLADMVVKRAEELSEISPAARRRAERLANAVTEFEGDTGLNVARSRTVALEDELAAEKALTEELKVKERERIDLGPEEEFVAQADKDGVFEYDTAQPTKRVGRVVEEREARRAARAASEERQAELVAGLVESREAEKAVRYSPEHHASLRERVLLEDPELVEQMVDSYHKELKDIASQLGPDAKEAFLKAEHEKTAFDHWRHNITPGPASNRSAFDPVFGDRPSGVGSVVGGMVGGAVAHAVGIPPWVGYRGAQYVGQAVEKGLRGGEVGMGSAPLKKIAVWAEAHRRNVEFDAAVGTAVKGFFSSKSAGAFTAPIIFSGHGEERDKKVQEFSDEVSRMVANPMAMAGHTQRSVGSLDEHSASQSMAAQQRIAENLQALHARLPKQSYQTNYPFGGSLGVRYSDQDVWALERYLAVAQDPIVALNAMKHNALSQEHVDALNETHPDVVNEVVKASLHHGKGSHSMQKLTQLHKLLGVAVSPEFEETTITGVQGTYMADRNKAQEGAQGNGSPSKPGSVSKSSATPASRLEAVQK